MQDNIVVEGEVSKGAPRDYGVKKEGEGRNMLLQKITKSNRLKTALIQQGQAKGVPMQDGIVCEDDSGHLKRRNGLF